MPSLFDLAYAGRPVAACRPWPRSVVDPAAWSFAVEQLADGRWTMASLWAEPDAVHMALCDETARQLCVITLACANGVYPSVGRRHPPAIRLERAVRDLWGHHAANSPDTRPWFDHGRWPAPPGRDVGAASPEYEFLPAEGPSLHQIAVGPVHAGIIEPGHFRFTVSGETIVRLEERLGYVHKGVEALMAGAGLDKGIEIAGRVSGDSTVAYALAYSRAAEAALGFEAPPRAAWLRALMAELERIANHLGDFGAICNDASFTLIHAHCGVLRERVLRASEACFGHRLMRDVIAPGGVRRDLEPAGLRALESLVADISNRLPALIKAYDVTTSLQDRTVGTGRLSAAMARLYGAGGFVGRASGRGFDARKAFAFAPYDALSFDAPTLEAGDVDARVWIRIREIEQSLSLIGRISGQMPEGPIFSDPGGTTRGGEGLAMVEGFRGDILAWIRLADDGRIERCHMRDPSWFQWPLLEAAIEGNIVADFPLCNKSFNCSYSGHDL